MPNEAVRNRQIIFVLKRNYPFGHQTRAIHFFSSTTAPSTRGSLPASYSPTTGLSSSFTNHFVFKRNYFCAVPQRLGAILTYSSGQKPFISIRFLPSQTIIESFQVVKIHHYNYEYEFRERLWAP